MPTPILPLNDRTTNNDYIAEASSLSIDYRTLTSQFGDGYVMNAGDGVNTKIVTWNVQYNNLTEANYTTMMTFLDTVQCNTSFYATPRGELQQLWRVVPKSLKVTHVIKNNLTNEIIRHITVQLRKTYA
jgi:phage-related protein